MGDLPKEVPLGPPINSGKIAGILEKYGRFRIFMRTRDMTEEHAVLVLNAIDSPQRKKELRRENPEFVFGE